MCLQRSTQMVNEYYDNMPLLALAFPALFPRGRGDYSMLVSKKKPYTFAAYITHLLNHSDRRFANHTVFVLYCYNRQQRKAINQLTSMASSKFQPLGPNRSCDTVQDLLERINPSWERNQHSARQAHQQLVDECIKSTVSHCDNLVGSNSY